MKKPSIREQLKGFRWFVFSAIGGVLGEQVFIGSILWLIALHFGASERYIGLLGFIVYSGAVFQIFSAYYAQRIPKKRFVLWTMGIAYISCTPLIFLGEVSKFFSSNAALALLFVCIACRQIWGNITLPSWMALKKDLTPSRIRGKLLGMLMTYLHISAIISLLFVSFYLGKSANWQKLRIVILLGLFSQGMRYFFVFFIPSFPQHIKQSILNWRDTFKVPLRDTYFRYFVLYLASYNFSLGLIEPFRVVFLVKSGFGENLSLFATSMSSLGAITTFMMWGKISDRFGNRSVLTIGLIGLAICSFLWTFVSIFGLGLAAFLFLLAGMFTAGCNIGNTKYMFSILRAEYDVSYITLATLVDRLGLGLGALVGGYVLHILQLAEHLDVKGWINGYSVVFWLSCAMFALPFFLRKKFRVIREWPTREVLMATLGHPLRTFLISFLSSGSVGKDVNKKDIDKNDIDDDDDNKR